EYWCEGNGKSRKRHRSFPVALSCSRITGICTVANDAQNGHSKSEYSVTSTRAESDPSVKPWIPSAAATRIGALGAGGAVLLCDWYHSAPPPITATATSNR